MVKKLLLSFSVMAVLSSCFKELETPIYPEYGKEFESFESYVSFEQAISNADFVYKNIDGNHRRKIQDVGLLTRSALSPSTRSSENDEPLAYVVNYSGNQGYAILAATEELPPVLVLGDEGNFSMSNFVEYVSGGNTRAGNNILSPEQELQYEIVNNSLNLVNPNIELNPNWVIANYSDTAILMKCMPLIPVKWHQRLPYNMYSPVVNDTLCPAGCVPVACAQSLATLCYRHNFRPSVEINANYTIDWRTINNLIHAGTIRFPEDCNTPDSRAVATLIRSIGEEVNAKYKTKGTGALPADAKSMYEKIGLKNVCLKYQNDSSLMDNLFNKIVYQNYPVDCYATRLEENNGEIDTVGHCFVADGWLRLQYTFTSYTNNNQGVSNLIENYNQHRFDLVHINFGWNGNCDGYYLPGVFDSTKNEFIDYREDEDMPTVGEYFYDIVFCYLMYEL